jgi:non-ribosomal peptide synthase protein (TIGR01720 family)
MPSLRVDVERHGREPIAGDLDVSRTVGWFTAVFPLDLPATADPAEVLPQVSARLRAVPHRGAGFGALRHLGEPATRDALAALAEPQVAFNYLGRSGARTAEGGSFRPGPAPAALDGVPAGNRAPASPRTRLLAAEAVVDGDQLRLGWTHDGRISVASANRLAEDYLDCVRELVDAAAAGTAGRRAADLSRTGLGGDAADRLRAALHPRIEGSRR